MTNRSAPHSAGPLRSPAVAWWNDTWAWRGAIAAAPMGALAAILHALLVLRLPPADALVAYAVGAMTAAGVACVLGGALGGAVTAFRRTRTPTVDAVDDRGGLDEDADVAAVERAPVAV